MMKLLYHLIHAHWLLSLLLGNVFSVRALSLPGSNLTLGALKVPHESEHDLGPHAGDIKRDFYADVAGEIAFFRQFFEGAANGPPKLYEVFLLDDLPDHFRVELSFYWYGSRNGSGLPRGKPSRENDRQYHMTLLCNVKPAKSEPCGYDEEVYGKNPIPFLSTIVWEWTKDTIPVSYEYMDKFRDKASPSGLILSEVIRKPTPEAKRLGLGDKPFWTLVTRTQKAPGELIHWVDMQSDEIVATTEPDDTASS